MFYLSVCSLVLLTIGSAYYIMHSLQEDRRKQGLFYSEVLPHITEARLTENRGLHPTLEGWYKNIRIKLVPLADNLCYRGLPRLYLRLYLAIDSDALCRIVNLDERKHLFPPVEFEKYSVIPEKPNPKYEVFFSGERGSYRAEAELLVRRLLQIENCCEILIQKKYIRVTLLLASGEKGYYAVLRAVKFPVLVLKKDNLNKILDFVFQLRREVAAIERAG